MKFAPFEEHFEALRQLHSEKEGLLKAVEAIEKSGMSNEERLPMLTTLNEAISTIGLEECDVECTLTSQQPLEDCHMPEVEVHFENGIREYPFGDHADFQPGKGGFSNYLCDVCGCILELNDTPVFMNDGSLSCNQGHCKK